ncbi:alpha/beta fold hydrolase [Herpetosiphon geysericola]|nr:alpha/beta hydrolase [Herpetosiphon geysericola]
MIQHEYEQLMSAADCQTCYQQTLERYPVQRVCINGHEWEICDTGGNLPGLLILPGGLARADLAFRWLDRCQQRYRVLSLAYPNTIDNLADLAANLQALFDYLQFEAGWIVAGSYSGLIAQALLHYRPQLAQGLLLSDTGVPRRGRWLWLSLLHPLVAILPLGLVRWLFWRGTQQFLQPMATMLRPFWAERLQQNLQKMQRHDYLSLLGWWRELDWHLGAARWHGKLAMIVAEHDGLFGRRDQALLRQYYPTASYYRVPQAQHCASLAQIDEYIDYALAQIEAT